MDELKQPEVFISKAKLHAFKRRVCGCLLCKPTACGHDVIVVGTMGNDKVYLCGTCAKKYWEIGWKIKRITF